MKEKILLLRWEKGKVPLGLMQLEKLIGNSTNEKSFSFPVKMVEVEGACVETVIINPSKKLLSDMIKITKDCIEKEGVKAVTSSCGFNAIFQEAMSEALPIPVFLSSLLQVPFVQTIIGRDKTVGILTANGKALTKKHLQCCNISRECNTVIMGLEECKEWNLIFEDENAPLNLEKVTQEILGRVEQGILENPNMGAIVLECTDLPPFASLIRHKFNIPVFDFGTMVNYMAMSLDEKPCFD